MQPGTIIRVFVASPNDVADQRRQVCEVLYEWNHLNSRKGFIVEPVLWETHSRAATGDNPQKLINRQLLDVYDCDVLVAIFHSRLGTPTDTHGAGSLEEIEYFSKLRSSKDRAMLFFCKWPIPHDTDTAELVRVKAFHAEAKKWSLCPEIYDQSSFKDTVRQHIHQALNEIVASQPTNQTQAKVTSESGLTEMRSCGQAMQRTLNAYDSIWDDAGRLSDTSKAAAVIKTITSLVTDLVIEYEPFEEYHPLTWSARWKQLVSLKDQLRDFTTRWGELSDADFWQSAHSLYDEFVAVTHVLQVI